MHNALIKRRRKINLVALQKYGHLNKTKMNIVGEMLYVLKSKEVKTINIELAKRGGFF